MIRAQSDTLLHRDYYLAMKNQERLGVLAAPRMVQSTFLNARLQSAGALLRMLRHSESQMCAREIFRGFSKRIYMKSFFKFSLNGGYTIPRSVTMAVSSSWSVTSNAGL